MKQFNFRLLCIASALFFFLSAVTVQQGYSQTKNGPLGVMYIEVNSNNFLNAGCYTLTTGQQLFDIAVIFAANINYDVAQQKAVLYNNTNVSTVLTNANTYIKPLQDKGIKVLLSILGNHQGAGFCNFTSRAAAHDFAQQLSDAVTTYNLDGIDFDDEYADYGTNSTGQPNDSSFVFLLSELRSLMPTKIISFYYYGPAASRLSYGGQKAGDFVNYSWNAIYGTYSVPNVPGLAKSQLAPAAVNVQSTSSTTAQSLATQTKTNGYGVYLYYNLPNTNINTYLSGISTKLYGTGTSLTSGCLQTWPPPTPVANFTANSTSITTGQSVTFTNTSTNATSYSWTFTGGTPATSTDTNPVVAYNTAGSYTVSLTATNASGNNVVTKTNYITVNDSGTLTNKSLTFNGTNKYINTGTVNLSGSAVSMEGWVKPAAFKSASPYISTVMGIEVSNANSALLRFGDASVAKNKLQFVLTIGGVQKKLASATTFSTGTWYHIAATYDGSKMRIYVNGTLDASLNTTGTVTANGAFNISYSYDLTRCLSGQMDEMRVWKRALTQAEIQANKCNVSTSATSLEGYWKFNEGTGSTAADATGHGHNGTLVNMISTDWSTDVPTTCGTAALRTVTTQTTLAKENVEVADVKNFTVYPNPVLRGGVLRISTPSAKGMLNVYSNNGSLLKTQVINSKITEVATAQFTGGLYGITVMDGNGKTFTKKVIVK